MTGAFIDGRLAMSAERRRLMQSVAAFVLFIAGWLAGGLFVDSRGVSDLMNGIVEYDLWEVMLGALVQQD